MAYTPVCQKIQLWSLIDQHIFQLLQCNFNMYRFGWGLACSPNLHMCTFMWIHDLCWAINVWLMKSSYHKSDLYISLLTLSTSQHSMCWVLLSTEESIKLKAQQKYCSFSVIKAELHMYLSYQWWQFMIALYASRSNNLGTLLLSVCY